MNEEGSEREKLSIASRPEPQLVLDQFVRRDQLQKAAEAFVLAQATGEDPLTAAVDAWDYSNHIDDLVVHDMTGGVENTVLKDMSMDTARFVTVLLDHLAHTRWKLAVLFREKEGIDMEAHPDPSGLIREYWNQQRTTGDQ